MADDTTTLGVAVEFSEQITRAMGPVLTSLDSFAQKLEASGNKAQAAGGQYGSFGSAFEAVSSATIAKGILLADALENVAVKMIGVGEKSVKMAGDLQQAVANISTIQPSVNTDKLFSQLNEMQTRVPQTAAQLGDAYYNIVSSIDVSQADALKLVETFAKGATGATTDAMTFGTAALGVMNAYGVSADGASHISDVFFNTVNKGVVTGKELAENLGLVTQGAKMAGVDIDELGGFIAGVTKEGGPAAQNINNLNNLLLKITTKEAQQEFHNMGIATTDATGAFRPQIDVLGDLKTKTDSMTESAKTAAIQKIFPDLQARAGATVIMDQLEFVRQAIDDNRTSAGSAEAAYEKMASTFNSQSQLLRNSSNAVLTELGSMLLPTVTAAMTTLSGAIVDTMARFNGFAATGLSGTDAALYTLDQEIRDHFGPGAASTFEDVTQKIGDFAGAVGENVGGMIGRFQSLVADGTTPLDAAFVMVGDFIRDHLGQDAADTFESFVTTASTTFQTVVEGGTALVTWFQQHWPEIQAVVQPIMDEIGLIVHTVITDVMTTFNLLSDLFHGDFGAAWSDIGTLVDTTMHLLEGTVSNVIDLVKADFSLGWDVVKSLTVDKLGGIVATVQEKMGGMQGILDHFMGHSTIPDSYKAGMTEMSDETGRSWTVINGKVSDGLGSMNDTVTAAQTRMNTAVERGSAAMNKTIEDAHGKKAPETIAAAQQRQADLVQAGQDKLNDIIAKAGDSAAKSVAQAWVKMNDTVQVAQDTQQAAVVKAQDLLNEKIKTATDKMNLTIEHAHGKTMNETIQRAHETANHTITAAQDRMNETVASATTRMNNTITSAHGAMNATLVSAYGAADAPTTQYWQGAGNAAQTGGARVVAATTQSMGQVVAATAQGFGAVEAVSTAHYDEATAATAAAMESQSHAIYGFINDALSRLGVDTEDVLSQFRDNFGLATDVFGQDVADQVSALFDLRQNWYDVTDGPGGVNESLSGMEISAGAALTEVDAATAASMESQSGAIYAFINGALARLGVDTEDVLAQFQTDMGTATDIFGQDVADQAQALFDLRKDWYDVTDGSGGIGEALDGMTADVGTALDDVGDDFTSFETGDLSPFETTIDNVLNGVGGVADDFGDMADVTDESLNTDLAGSMTAFLDGPLAGLLSDTEEDLNGSLGSVTASFGDLASNVDDDLGDDGVAGSIADFVTGALADFPGDTDEALNGSDSVTSKWDDLYSNIDGDKLQIEGDMDDLADDADTLVERFGTIETIAGEFKDVTEAAGTALDAIHRVETHGGEVTRTTTHGTDGSRTTHTEYHPTNPVGPGGNIEGGKFSWENYKTFHDLHSDTPATDPIVEFVNFVLSDTSLMPLDYKQALSYLFESKDGYLPGPSGPGDAGVRAVYEGLLAHGVARELAEAGAEAYMVSYVGGSMEKANPVHYAKQLGMPDGWVPSGYAHPLSYGGGGVVAGSTGAPVMALVHGGEGIFTPDQLAVLGATVNGRGGGGGLTIMPGAFVNYGVMGVSDAEEWFVGMLEKATRTGRR